MSLQQNPGVSYCWYSVLFEKSVLSRGATDILIEFCGLVIVNSLVDCSDILEYSNETYKHREFLSYTFIQLTTFLQ